MTGGTALRYGVVSVLLITVQVVSLWFYSSEVYRPAGTRRPAGQPENAREVAEILRLKGADAFRSNMEGHTRGKIVVAVD